MFFMAGDGGKGTLIRLRDKTIHRSYASLAPTQRFSTAFCPLEKVVVAFQARSSAYFFTPHTQQPAHRSFTPEQVTSCAVSSCGTFLVGGGQNGSLLAWSLRSGQLLKNFRAHLRSVTSISFSPDNSLVMTTSEDSVCKVWSLASLMGLTAVSAQIPPVSTFTGHTLSVTCGTFLQKNGLLAVTGSADKTCRLFAVTTGEQLAQFTVGDAITAVATSEDDSSLVAGTNAGFLYFHTLLAEIAGKADATMLAGSAGSAHHTTAARGEARFLPPSEDGHNSPIVFLKFVGRHLPGGHGGRQSTAVGQDTSGTATTTTSTDPVLSASEGGAVLWYDAASCQLIGEAFPRQRHKILSGVYFPDTFGESETHRVTVCGLSKNPVDPTEKSAYAVERLAKRPRKESQLSTSSARSMAGEAHTQVSPVPAEEVTDPVDEELHLVEQQTAELEKLRAKMLKKLAKVQQR